MSSCTIGPQPLTLQQQSLQIAQDRARMFAGQPPVSGSVTLEEAMARALAYNLDLRVAVMQQAVAHLQARASLYDLLPKFSGDAAIDSRSNQNAELSRNTSTNFLSLLPATSEDRTIGSGDLTASWSLIDFGVSYYEARSQLDKALIAREERRRAAEQLIEKVRTTFWSAAVADRLMPKVEATLADARGALANAREIESERLRDPLDTLRYERGLLDVIKTLEGVQETLGEQKATLAGLINLPPDQDFALQAPADRTTPTLKYTVAQLELIALYNRPEVRAATYQGRISIRDTREAVLRLLPNPTLDAGLDFNSNSFLINKAWADVGARVTWNLVELLAARQVIGLSKSKTEVADEERRASSMAAMVQVNVAYHQLLHARQQYDEASAECDVDQRIADNTSKAYEVGNTGELDRIRAVAQAVISELGRDEAYADMENALASLYTSLGLDPIGAMPAGDLSTWSAALRETNRRWQAGDISPPVWPPELETQSVPTAAATR